MINKSKIHGPLIKRSFTMSIICAGLHHYTALKLGIQLDFPAFGYAILSTNAARRRPEKYARRINTMSKRLLALLLSLCLLVQCLPIYAKAVDSDVSDTVTINEVALKFAAYSGSGNATLTSVTLPENGTTEVEIPSTVTLKTSSGATRNFTVTKVNESACSGRPVTKVVLPPTVTKLGSRAFLGCTSLSSINLENITEFGSKAFENNSISVYSDLTIKGYSGSPAQTFANERNCKFVPLDVVEEGKTLTLTVHDPEGNAVAEGYRIQWLNESGEVVWANARYPNAQNGTYRVKVILEEELAWEYQEPGEQSVTVNGADATVEVALTKRPTAAVTGKVVDNKGKPIDGAGITAARADGGPDVTGTSGADGTFSLTVTQGTDITLTVKKQGYYTRSQLIEALTADVSLGDIAMNPAAPGNRIAIAMELVPAAKEGSSSINTPPVSYEGFAFTVKKADGSTVIAEIQGTQLILTPGQAAPGDVLTVSASDPSGNYADSEPVTVSLTQNATGSAVITLTELGGVNLGDVQSQKPASVMVFDSTGKWVRTASAVKDTTIKPLPAGSYTLVFIEDNDLLRSVPSIAYLSELGLTEGTAYVSKSVAVRNGKIEVLGTVTVPRLNEEQLSIISTSSVSLTQPGD